MERKNGWVFTSDAPAREPIRRSSSFIKSLRMRDLQRLETCGEHSTAYSAKEEGVLETYCEICGAPECSGNGTSSRRMLANV